MPKNERFKTKYPGVTYIMGTSTTGKPEKVYYIRYRKDGKLIEEKAGRQYQHDMTPARAAQKRAKRIEGELSNQEQREKAEAERKARENRWTFKRLWEAYKNQKPDLKGMVTDQNRFEKHISPILGEKEPSELAPLDIDRIRINLGKTLSPGTVRNVMELIRRLINFGTRKNLCSGTHFQIELPKVNNERTEDLTPDELQSLMEAIEADDNIQAANLMKMALFTGMRRGELFNLQWSDIDFERNFIWIRDPKGGINQKIPLNDAAKLLLKEHPRSESPYVFPGKTGEKRTDIKRPVNRIKKKAGLPKDFRALHGLRHVYASMLASTGKVDMYTLQKLLTHKSPAMTQRYAHLRDEALRSASDLAGALVLNSRKSKAS